MVPDPLVGIARDGGPPLSLGPDGNGLAGVDEPLPRLLGRLAQPLSRQVDALQLLLQDQLAVGGDAVLVHVVHPVDGPDGVEHLALVAKKRTILKKDFKGLS